MACILKFGYDISEGDNKKSFCLYCFKKREIERDIAWLAQILKDMSMHSASMDMDNFRVRILEAINCDLKELSVTNTFWNALEKNEKKALLKGRGSRHSVPINFFYTPAEAILHKAPDLLTYGTDLDGITPLIVVDLKEKNIAMHGVFKELKEQPDAYCYFGEEGVYYHRNSTALAPVLEIPFVSIEKIAEEANNNMAMCFPLIGEKFFKVKTEEEYS